MRRWFCGMLLSMLGTWPMALAAQPYAASQAAGVPDAPTVEVLRGVLLRASQTGAMRLAYRDDTLPFSYVPAGRTRPVGYAVSLCREVVKAVSEHLGMPMQIQWLRVDASNRFDVLEQGRADLLCGSTSDTAERRARTGFSPPMFYTGTRLLVAADQPVRRLADLDGRAVAVVAGTTAQQALPALANQTGVVVDVHVLPGYQAALDALVAGRAQALLADDVLLAGLSSSAGAGAALRIVGPWLTHEVYGLAFPAGDVQFDALVKATWTRLAHDGRFDQLYGRWFLRRLPGGERLALPMSTPLRQSIDMLSTLH